MKVIAEYRTGEKTLRLVEGDITERDTEAIVNAANSHLQHGGGVAGAIVRRGGQSIQDESDRIGFTPVGTAVITGAGRLASRFVIHAVGPRMGEGDEDSKLQEVVLSVLRLASARKLSSLSMPAISSGIFGFPKDRCAKVLVAESLKFITANTDSSLKVIEFCIFDDLTLGHFKKEFAELKQGQSAS